MPLEKRPWHPGVNMSPQKWDRMETNRVKAAERKVLRQSFPPFVSSAPYIPPAPPAWKQPNQTPFGSMFLAPRNPYANHAITATQLQLQQTICIPNPYAKTASAKSSPLNNITNVAVSKPVNEVSLCQPASPSKSPAKKKTKINAEDTDVTAPKKAPPPREYNCHQYTFHKFLSKGWIRMKCSFHRNSACKNCNAFIKVLQNDDGTEAIISGGEHVPACITKNSGPAQHHDQAKDCTEVMKDFVEKRATSNDHHTDLPNKIWNDTVAHFRSIMGLNFQGMTKSQVRSLVYNVRERSFGGDVVSKVEQLYSGDIKNSFLRHHVSFPDEDCCQRIMCFSDPQLLALLSYASVSIFLRHMFVTKCLTHAILFRFKCLLMLPMALFPILSTSVSSSWSLIWRVIPTFHVPGCL